MNPTEMEREEKKASALRMTKAGVTAGEIGRRVGVSSRTVQRWRKAEVKRLACLADETLPTSSALGR
mgnify:CR=1 FL=1